MGAMDMKQEHAVDFGSGCGQCEKACPQHLPVRKYLGDVAAKFEA